MHKDLIDENENVSEQQQAPEETVSIFSKELLRDILLPDLLGREHSQILYWAGKQLARKFPLNNMDEVIEFFENAGWGELVEDNSSKKEAEFILSGHVITRRFDLNEDSEFQLEAGFLAQQIEMMNKRITEAACDPKKKSSKVKFLVRWDSKDIIDS
jgi:predicted hydrocarbon binding protein